MGMETLYRLQTPCLPFLPLFFTPLDGLPIWGQNQASRRVGDLNPCATWLIDIEKKGLLNGMLVRASLDKNTIFQTNVRSQQHLLTAIDRIGKVVQTPWHASMIFGDGEVI